MVGRDPLEGTRSRSTPYRSPATFIVGRTGVIPRMGIEDMLVAPRRAP
jgi:hypothetical protein